VKAKDLNILQKLASDGDSSAESELLLSLSAIFLHFVQQKVWDSLDCEEIVQDTIMIITTKHKEIKFESSFTAWAYNVLKNTLLKYYRTKGLHQAKFEQYEREFVSATSIDIPVELNLRLSECLKKINNLNNRYARIINLKHQGFTTEEICKK